MQRHLIKAQELDKLLRFVYLLTNLLCSVANVFVKDAYVLGALLCHPLTTVETLPIALKVYEEIRLHHGNDVIKRSRRNGQLFEFYQADFQDLRNTNVEENDLKAKARLDSLNEAVEKNWEWAWTTSPVDDKEAALALLQKRIGGSA